jgi:hypothetical protein
MTGGDRQPFKEDDLNLNTTIAEEAGLPSSQELGIHNRVSAVLTGLLVLPYFISIP